MTTRIDAPSNPRIAAAVKAAAMGDAMLLEGRRMIEDALDAGIQIEEIFVRRDSEEEKIEKAFLGRRGGEGGSRPAAGLPPRVTEVSARVLRKLSDLPSTRGAVALAVPPRRTLSSLSPSPPSSSFFLILDDVQDPANVGAILRSAEAFGASAALLTPGCSWPFSPRALRASAGSAFRLPVVPHVTAGPAVLWARENGIALVGAEARGGTGPEAVGLDRPFALVIGSEGHGISPEIAAALDHRVTIPLAGRVESLNAAVAASLLLHVLSRGRPTAG